MMRLLYNDYYFRRMLFYHVLKNHLIDFRNIQIEESWSGYDWTAKKLWMRWGRSLRQFGRLKISRCSLFLIDFENFSYKSVLRIWLPLSLVEKILLKSFERFFYHFYCEVWKEYKFLSVQIVFCPSHHLSLLGLSGTVHFLLPDVFISAPVSVCEYFSVVLSVLPGPVLQVPKAPFPVLNRYLR